LVCSRDRKNYLESLLRTLEESVEAHDWGMADRRMYNEVIIKNDDNNRFLAFVDYGFSIFISN
jgi:hypothetical protein